MRSMRSMRLILLLRLLAGLLLATVARADLFSKSGEEVLSADSAHLLAGLLAGEKAMLAIVRGNGGNWWLLRPGDTVPGTDWYFDGIAAGRGLFSAAAADDAGHLILGVGGRIDRP